MKIHAAPPAVSSQLLVRTPRHYQTESLLGYSLRVSEKNGYASPRDVFITAGVTLPQVRQPNGLFTEKIAKIVGTSADRLKEISYSGLDGGLRRPTILGNTLPVRFLRLKCPQLCPRCVTEHGFLSAYWDLAPVVACPWHGSMLLRSCGACGRELSWYRPGLMRCGCGADLNQETPAAPPQLAELTRFIAQAACGQQIPPKVEFDTKPSTALAGMTLRQLLKLVETLGKLSAYGDFRRGACDWELVVSRAADALHPWPSGFHELIRQFDQGAKPDSVRYYSRFGRLYYGLLRKHFGPHRAFLRAEFDNYGKFLHGDGLVTRADFTPTEGRYVSLTEAAQRLGVNPATVRGYIGRGLLKAKVTTGQKVKRYLVDLGSFELGLDNAQYSMCLRKAAGYIGLPMNLLKRFRTEGIYRVRRRSARITFYHQLDLNAFRDQLIGKAPVLLDAETSKCSGVSLGKILRTTRLGTKEQKTELFRFLQLGLIVPAGRTGQEIGSIVLPKEQTVAFLNAGQAERSRRTNQPELAGQTLSQKRAAAYLNIPLPVFKHLRRLEHPAIKAFAVGTPITVSSLAAFEKPILEIGMRSPVCALNPDGALTIGYMLRNLRFRSEEGKPGLILAVRDGLINVVGLSGNTLADVVLDRREAMTYFKRKRSEAEGHTNTVREVAATLGCFPQTVRGLLKGGHLRASGPATRLRIDSQSVREFDVTYVSLDKIAKRIGVRLYSLAKLCRERKLPYVLCRYSGRDSPQPFVFRKLERTLTSLARSLHSDPVPNRYH